ncbi:hypothetical protein INS49_009064 [Diaporthe citri]|uniref:uncharacterized protein n=1 Tax=Diaporthe citri TaxID=83186 RepID=UPI001C8238C8|nr:uncharacterized protein INS49_009064 [Diaporthe citri]KAG6363961.1 hypothetical protein INS49_009064 [Diaporthe citri]
MDSETAKQSFRLLELPPEIRDMVYVHVLFASAHTTDISQRKASLDIDVGTPIHTNILLTSRHVFQEARNVIIGAQLVQVITCGGKHQDLRTGAAMEDRIPTFHTRYRHFCLLKHIMDENYLSESWQGHDDISYIIRKDDLSRFCRGLFVLDPVRCDTPTLDPNISHCLVMVDPEARLRAGPAHVSMTVPSHKYLFQIYQKVLRGCEDFWISAHSSVEPDRDFMNDMAEKIRSGNILRS